LTVGTFANLLQRLGTQRRDSNRGDLAGGEPVAEVEFRISNMVCEGCAEKIDRALRSIVGVREMRANVRHQRIRVRYEPTKVDPERIKSAVNQAGFQVVDT